MTDHVQRDGTVPEIEVSPEQTTHTGRQHEHDIAAAQVNKCIDAGCQNKTQIFAGLILKTALKKTPPENLFPGSDNENHQNGDAKLGCTHLECIDILDTTARKAKDIS